MVYTKRDYHLCEHVLEKLEELNSQDSMKIATGDITRHQEFFGRYKYLIPIVAVDGKVKLTGAALANLITLEDMLRRTIFHT